MAGKRVTRATEGREAQPAGAPEKGVRTGARSTVAALACPLHPALSPLRREVSSGLHAGVREGCRAQVLRYPSTSLSAHFTTLSIDSPPWVTFDTMMTIIAEL